MMQTEQMTPEYLQLIERLAEIPAANVGDAMDRLGLVDAGIEPVWRGARVVGPAYTVWVREGDNKGVHEAIAQAPAGSVIVVNGGGYLGRALMGELMAGRAKKKGIKGFIYDACVRDRQDLAEMEFPVFARGICPAGPYKDGPFRNQVPVAIGGVVVAPGDTIVADDDGIAVIPQDRLAEVTEKAEAVKLDEAGRRQVIWGDQA